MGTSPDCLLVVMVMKNGFCLCFCLKSLETYPDGNGLKIDFFFSEGAVHFSDEGVHGGDNLVGISGILPEGRLF